LYAGVVPEAEVLELSDDGSGEVVFSSEHLAINPLLRQQLMMGRLDQLPIIQSQVVRLYISSIYSGMYCML